MKRLVLTVALCVVASASFAQKKNVNTAQRIAKGENPDYKEARSLMKDALENPETKDDAKTWFVAGFVEQKQFDVEKQKLLLGQQPNEPVMYEALGAIMPYFMKAYELDQQPNEKGKVKPKYTKDIKGLITANHPFYINAGGYYYNKQDFQKAYDFFKQYTDIVELPMLAGEKVAEKDSNYYQFKYYGAVAASQMGKHKEAVACLQDIKGSDYKQDEIYQFICLEYDAMKDSVNFEKALLEGAEKFPNEKFYLLSLINVYTFSDQNEKALQFINKALEQDQTAQLYDIQGKVYEALNDSVAAETSYNKALQLDPKYMDSISNLGRMYYNRGVKILDEANGISDTKLYQEGVAKAKVLFEKARPYFEEVRKAKPESAIYRDALIGLRGIYYNMGMGAELEGIEAELNNK